MSRLVLYRAMGSPPARAVMMLGDTLGLNFEIKEVNILKLEHMKPEFKKLNPMATLPVLQDKDFVVSESHAIMMYLLNKYGGDKREELYPSEAHTRAIVDQCLFFDSGYFFPNIRAVGMATLLKGLDGPSEQHRRGIETSYSVIEAYLEQRRYIATDHLTLADLSCGSTATAIQAMHKLDAVKFPRCADWLARLEDEPLFKKINAPGVAYFTKLIHKAWAKNKEQT